VYGLNILSQVLEKYRILIGMSPTPFGGRGDASAGRRWAGWFILFTFLFMEGRKDANGIATSHYDLNRQIRRGGAPSGAAGFIAFGGMGASAPIL